jgi:hypothetical protein
MALGTSYSMVFPLPIPACCKASGNRNWEDVGKGILLQREYHGPVAGSGIVMPFCTAGRA